MRKTFIIIMIIFSTALCSAGFILKENLNPTHISFLGGKIFIADGAEVFIYSADKGSLIKRYGKKGNGPGEFNVNHSYSNFLKLLPLKERIFLYTSYKLAFTDYNGNLISEKKLNFYSFGIMPLENGFISKKFSMKNSTSVYSISIYDKDLKPIKTIDTQEKKYKMGIFEPVSDYFDFRVNNKNIITLISGDSTCIKIYDLNGNLKKRHILSEKRVEVKDKYKKEIEQYLKTKAWYTNIPAEYRKKILFAEKFPICKNLSVNKENIILQTYRRKNDLSEFLFINRETFSVKKCFLPVTEKNIMEDSIYCFSDNKYFYIRFNSDDQAVLKTCSLNKKEEK